METFLKGLVAFGIGVIGIIYDRLRYSMQSKKEFDYVRTRLLWGSWMAILAGIFLIVVSFLSKIQS